MHAVTNAGGRAPRESPSVWRGPGLARKMEHALFTVTLAAMGYLWLSPLVAAVWI
jgi:hypothetical protein